MSAAPRPRPKYYDLNLAHLPPPGLLSIFHRVSGALLFFPILPLLLYGLQATLGSEAGYARWHEFLDEPLVKLVIDRKSTRLNSSHIQKSRMPSSA